MNKITSFPHTLSLCSKKAESKVKRVKSYYCTRVCQNMPNAQTYMYGVPKLFRFAATPERFGKPSGHAALRSGSALSLPEVPGGAFSGISRALEHVPHGGASQIISALRTSSRIKAWSLARVRSKRTHGALIDLGSKHRSIPKASPPSLMNAEQTPPNPQKSSKRYGTLGGLGRGGSTADRMGPPSGVLG